MLKIKFTDAFPDVVAKKTISILTEHFQEVEESDEPDFLFYSVTGHEHLKYDCVRIFWTGENLQPDFNICDYAIGFSRMTFEDRYVRIPLYFFYDWDYELALKKHMITRQEIENKKSFCNFIYSNGNASPERVDFYNMLSQYKKIDSGGRFMNNIGKTVENKHNFQSAYRFSIAFENSSTSGYTTEKILQAFSAGTIPIYWGNPNIGEEFNEKAFVNCHSYGSFEEVAARVKEIDRNDELFEEYLKQPISGNGVCLPEDPYAEYEAFIVRICRQEPKAAFRRNNVFWGERYQKEQKEIQLYREYLKAHNRKWHVRVRNKVRRMLGKRTG